MASWFQNCSQYLHEKINSLGCAHYAVILCPLRRGRTCGGYSAEKTKGDDAMTLSGDIEIINPPSAIADSPLIPETYNRMLQDVFGDDSVDVAKEDGLNKLTEHLQHETSNGLFAKLKKREKDFHGGIFLNPIQAANEQTILVSARVIYLEKGKKRFFGTEKDQKIMRSEILFIRFTPKGAFKNVEKGIATRQVVEK